MLLISLIVVGFVLQLSILGYGLYRLLKVLKSIDQQSFITMRKSEAMAYDIRSLKR